MTPKATTRLICPLTSPTVEAMRRDMTEAARRGADAVELRLDFLERPPTPAELRDLLAHAPVEVIATCRPTREGGRFDGPEDERLALLAHAAEAGAAYLDVELDVPHADRPEGESILSHHDFDRRPADLASLARRLDRSDAAVNKVAFAAAGPEDALAALDLPRSCRKPTISLAMGDEGVISRILAGKVGAFGTFATLAEGAESAPGQPTLQQLRELYRWESVGPDTRVFGVVGCPVAHSMSPAIHNAALAATGIDGVYVPLLIHPGPEPFGRFMDALLERPWLNWRGLSVTLPHKQNALAYVGAGRCDDLAVRIGAVNTVTLEPDGSLRGDNTDYAAAVDSLCEIMGIAREQLAGRHVAVVGAGGVARALVAALAHYGAEIAIYNRTVSRGEQLAEEFQCRAAPLAACGAADAEIIINCTSVGMHPRTDASPLAAIPPAARVVFDTIYNPVRTKLLTLAEAAGCKTVTGLDMFVRQAVGQFEIWTGRPAPRDVMRDVVVRELAGKNDAG